MRTPRTLWRYVARETLVHTALGFLFAAPLILIPNVLQRLDDYVRPGVSLGELAAVARSMALLVTGYTLPVAFLVGLLLAVGRLVGDREIAAMRGCGVDVRALLVPAVGAGALLAAAAAVLSLEVEYRAWRDLVSARIAIETRARLLETGAFQRFGPREILVQERGDDGGLRGVALSDASGARPFTVFAESGRLERGAGDGEVRLELARGDLRMEPGPNAEDDAYRISFERADYAFAAGPAHWRLRPSHLSPGELWRAWSRAREGERLPGLRYQAPRFYETQVHRMLAVPAAPLCFALLGTPLGCLGLVRSRARGALAAVAVFAGYYALFTWGYGAAQTGRVDPALALWLPNACIVALGLPLLWAARRARR